MEVGTVATVTVTAGSTKTQNIASSEAAISPVWSFGDRDGTPRGFYFADKIERTHPTIGSWPAQTLTAVSFAQCRQRPTAKADKSSLHPQGSSPASSFPMALWQGQNQPLTIKFTLTAAQVKASTVDVGVTSSFAGGRPTVAVNGVSGAIPDAPVKIDSRGVSRGALGSVRSRAIDRG
jgi:rhamnogalacturonan endolyase